MRTAYANKAGSTRESLGVEMHGESVAFEADAALPPGSQAARVAGFFKDADKRPEVWGSEGKVLPGRSPQHF